MNKRVSVINKMSAEHFKDKENMEVLRGKLVAYNGILKNLVANTTLEME